MNTRRPLVWPKNAIVCHTDRINFMVGLSRFPSGKMSELLFGPQKVVVIKRWLTVAGRGVFPVTFKNAFVWVFRGWRR